MNVVIDTNVLISAVLSPEGNPAWNNLENMKAIKTARYEYLADFSWCALHG
jgi:predicted nucleic acid-binding protein